MTVLKKNLWELRKKAENLIAVIIMLMVLIITSVNKLSEITVEIYRASDKK